MTLRALRAAGAAGIAVALAGCTSVGSPSLSPPQSASSPDDRGIFFDDFDQPDLAALQRSGWTVRERRGHPGIDGAGWGAANVALVDDPERPGNRLLRLEAATDGTPPGTTQAQLCHARKYLEGTYAARIRFGDAPRAGPRGDVVVQTFYAVAPLRFDFDPEYSEFDWEYLPNGGWGDARPRLYGVSWQTVRVEPWLPFNQPYQAFGSMDGWHTLAMQIAAGRTRLFIDGIERAEHGGRNYPVVPMSINFSVWFSPGGLLAITGGGKRAYRQEVDWVLHARDVVLSPAEIEQRVAAFRRAGVHRTDGVPASDPPLPSPCDF